MRKLLAAALVFSLFAVSGCQKESAGVKPVEKAATAENSGVKAYDFTFTDVNGKKHNLSDYRGKVVVVQFFGTYCPPCKAEMPALEEIYKKHGGKVVVIGLSVDYIGLPSEKLKSFVKEMGITYPVGSSTEKAWEEYAGRITGLDSIPQTFIIDKEGRIRYYEVGFTPTYIALFEKAVDELLKE